jgi:hypothetical protein
MKSSESVCNHHARDNQSDLLIRIFVGLLGVLSSNSFVYRHYQKVAGARMASLLRDMNGGSTISEHALTALCGDNPDFKTQSTNAIPLERSRERFFLLDRCASLGMMLRWRD